MAAIIDGKAISEQIRQELAAEGYLPIRSKETYPISLRVVRIKLNYETN